MSSDEHESDDDSAVRLASGPGFIDDEAEESGGDMAEEALDGQESAVHCSFPQFVQLPPELRHQIWHFYCPDLSAKTRVLQFILSPSSAAMNRPLHYSAKDHISLADQTQTLRAVLSTHRESRRIALLRYPDELRFDAGSGDAIVRFRKDTDVINLDDVELGVEYFLPDFATEIQNLACDPMGTFGLETMDDMSDEMMSVIRDLFPNMRKLYSVTPWDLQRPGALWWCTTDRVHKYMMETYEKSPGLGEDMQWLFCWPDPEGHPEFTRYLVPRLCSFEKESELGVQVAVIVEFDGKDGVDFYDRLKAYNEEESDVVPADLRYITSIDTSHFTDDLDYADDLDEYESEGIDDGDVLEPGDSTEDEDDLLPGEIGRFSSPESDGDEATDQADGELLPRSPKRKATVLDSDEDDVDSGHGPPRKRARQTRLVLDSDDEQEREEDAQPDESEVRASSTRRVRTSARAMLISSDDETKAGSDSRGEGGEEDVPARLSLAERLRRRSEHAVSSGSEGDLGQSDEQTDEQTDEDGGEEDEEGDEDEDEDEDGLLDTMAGDGTEDEDEDEDEDTW
ncbi:hypothetical protein E4U53_005883 [Claviceps sorghi]|nr:hypothetical protein E4U53_005883 [Claviceps sorghi]